MRGFCETVIGFFHRTATGPERIRKRLTPIAAGFFAFLVLLTIALSFLMDRFFGLTEFIARPYGAAVSLPFLAGGLWLWLWSVGRFLKAKGTPMPVNPPRALVTDGPYAYSRNPMMTGVFLMLAGIGILFGSVFLTFVGTPLLAVMSVAGFKCVEEPELERRFGRAYMAYRDRTPILIPRLRRK